MTTVHRLCSVIFAGMFSDELWNGVDDSRRPPHTNQYCLDCCDAHSMSQLGLKQTNHRRPKSIVVRCCPKADKRGRGWIVR